MRINHNIASLNTYRQLSANSANGQKSLEKLSSGLRINKAGDDAAGLAISEKMRSQIRGLDQAARNSQDAISLIQTAEGALSETHSILQRMRELAVQSASETNTDNDRTEIQKEINQLTSEINRIGNTTEFNTKKLLNGNYEYIAATSGTSTAKAALSNNVDITSNATNATATGGAYGASGNTSATKSSATLTGNVVLNENSAIAEGTNNELTIEVDGVTHNITLTDGETGTADILTDLNTAFTDANIGAIASYDENKQLVIKSLTAGSGGSIGNVSGGFADAFIAARSTNTATVSAQGEAATATKNIDYVSVQLEGSDGQMHTVKLNTVDATTGANTATTYKKGAATTDDEAANIREAFEIAIAANDKLAGRYHITGSASDITITAAKAGDGYSISKVTFDSELGEETSSTIAGTAGAASNVANTVYVEGKDVGDVWVHGDTGASVSGSITMTDTTLASSSVAVATGNNELTYSIDGEETTIVMANKTYNGTGRVFATNSTTISGETAGQTLTLAITGREGTSKTLTITGHAANQDSDEFKVESDLADTVQNMKTALQAAIDADESLKGLFTVSVQDGFDITVSATKASAELTVGVFGGTGGETAGTASTGAAGTSIGTLVEDLQSSIDAKSYSTYKDTVTGIAVATDTYAIQLEGADGTMETISLAAHAATTSTALFKVGADAKAQAFNISKALALAIEDNENLKGRYEVSSLGADLTIKATGTGDGYSIGQSTEGQVGGATFAVTNGAAVDAQMAATATVSVNDENKLQIVSANTGTGSTVAVTGGNLADSLFGTVGTRTNQSRLAANDKLSVEVDGVAKEITVAKQTYQNLAEFISVNQDAFKAAGVTASDDGNGKLKLTSDSSGVSSKIGNIGSGDLASQVGLTSATLVQGANGNTTLNLTVDGEEINAEIQEGTYTDRELLAAAVQSAINNASTTAKDVAVSVNADNELVITSGSTGSTSKIQIGTHDTKDAAGILGLTGNDAVTGTNQENANITFQIGANKDQAMGLSIKDVRANALGITGSGEGFSATKNVTDGTNNDEVERALDVTTTESASKAIDAIDSAITMVSAERAKLGASQNRLEHTINNLGTSSENLTAAESRIRDVDMAKEMMEFTKNNILSQAAQAMLAQANQQPQGVLQLLR